MLNPRPSGTGPAGGESMKNSVPSLAGMVTVTGAGSLQPPGAMLLLSVAERTLKTMVSAFSIKLSSVMTWSKVWMPSLESPARPMAMLNGWVKGPVLLSAAP